MRIYLEADVERRGEIHGHAYTLRSHGHKVVSTWHDDEAQGGIVAYWTEEGIGPGGSQFVAEADMSSIRACDMFILFTTGTAPLGGQQVKLGCAWGARKRVVVIGPLENMFRSLLAIDRYESWGQFLLWNTQGGGQVSLARGEAVQPDS